MVYFTPQHGVFYAKKYVNVIEAKAFNKNHANKNINKVN